MGFGTIPTGVKIAKIVGPRSPLLRFRRMEIERKLILREARDLRAIQVHLDGAFVLQQHNTFFDDDQSRLAAAALWGARSARQSRSR